MARKAFLLASLWCVVFASPSFAYEFDSSLPGAVKDQMVLDLGWIDSVEGRGATPLHQQIFGLVNGHGYSEFFGSRVNLIGFNSCGGGAAVACVVPSMGSDRIWITNNYIRFQHPQVARLMVVFHESRHTEVSHRNWGHARCPRPFKDAQGRDMKSIFTGASLAGEAACDITPMGSYGSSTILLKNLQKYCTNCSEKIRQDAGLYADDQLGRITNASAKRAMIADFRAQ